MKFKQHFLVATIACLPATAMAESFLQGQDVRVVGDQSAAKACRAIIRDDADELRDALKQVRRETLYAHRYDPRDEAIVGSVKCNDMGLAEFAGAIGAGNVTDYLDQGTVVIEEVVATSD